MEENVPQTENIIPALKTQLSACLTVLQHCVFYLFIILPVMDSEEIFTNGARYQGYTNDLCTESMLVLVAPFVHLAGEANWPIRNTGAGGPANKNPNSCDTTTRRHLTLAQGADRFRTVVVSRQRQR